MSPSILLQEQILTGLRHEFPQMEPLAFYPVAGGSINRTYKLMSGSMNFFCKANSATKFPQLFEKEMLGLQFLGAHGIQTPKVYFPAEQDDEQVLVMEWIEEGERTASFWKQFGEALARLHSVTHASFGFDTDNYMGSVPQSNQWARDWCSFFQTRRLEALVDQCGQRGLLSVADVRLFEQLYQKLPEIFDANSRPGLQHGDLWAGNFLCSAAGSPVLIDPAVYYGHPAVDIGMSRLFGGFESGFYEAYGHYTPLPSQQQCDVANLYPLLVHLLLFGNSYKGRILSVLQRFQ